MTDTKKVLVARQIGESIPHVEDKRMGGICLAGDDEMGRSLFYVVVICFSMALLALRVVVLVFRILNLGPTIFSRKIQ